MSFDPSTRERWSGYSAMRTFFRQQEKYENDSNFDGWHGLSGYFTVSCGDGARRLISERSSPLRAERQSDWINGGVPRPNGWSNRNR
jgi:hypothetical protein